MSRSRDVLSDMYIGKQVYIQAVASTNGFNSRYLTTCYDCAAGLVDNCCGNACTGMVFVKGTAATINDLNANTTNTVKWRIAPIKNTQYVAIQGSDNNKYMKVFSTATKDVSCRATASVCAADAGDVVSNLGAQWQLVNAGKDSLGNQLIAIYSPLQKAYLSACYDCIPVTDNKYQVTVCQPPVSDPAKLPETSKWKFMYVQNIISSTELRSLNDPTECLDVPGAVKTSVFPLQTYSCHGGDNQIWTFSNGSIRNKLSGLCFFGNARRAYVHQMDCGNKLLFF